MSSKLGYGAGMVTIDCDTAEELYHISADIIVAEITAVLKTRSFATLTLAGGATPKGVYSILAGSQDLPWEKVHLLFGDERAVPADSMDSNYHMANETLISRISIPAANVHRIRTEIGLDESAHAYELEIQSLYAASTPSLDVLLLGIGPDGHTASLFPDQPQLGARNLVTATPPAPREPRVERVTMTYPLLNSASTVIFLVSGEEKSSVVRRILAGGRPAEALPAHRINPRGRLIWTVYPPVSKP